MSENAVDRLVKCRKCGIILGGGHLFGAKDLPIIAPAHSKGEDHLAKIGLEMIKSPCCGSGSEADTILAGRIRWAWRNKIEEIGDFFRMCAIRIKGFFLR